MIPEISIEPQNAYKQDFAATVNVLAAVVYLEHDK